MLNRTNRVAAALLAALALVTAVAAASVPTVSELDAQARAAGNRKDLAMKIGESIFDTTWPAQVSQVSANQLGSHLIVGVRVWGVKFHESMTRAQFVSQIVALAGKVFSAEPATEEVDIWASVPIAVGKDVVVSGDLAKPTTRVVYSISIRRGESPSALAHRAAGTNGVYWDEEWARRAFKE